MPDQTLTNETLSESQGAGGKQVYICKTRNWPATL